MPLPWSPDTTPLMLAPMQGLTNRGMRDVFVQTVRPDVVFTEFVRVKPRSATPITPVDLIEASTPSGDVPLVVQVIGSAEEGVVEATRALIERGVQHINVNMGCPFGRMTSVLAGGGMFKYPETIEPMLTELRAIVPGSLSVKTRLGISSTHKIFELLPCFENAGVDFLIVHARTVQQKYRGTADHDLSQALVQQTRLPFIANGDVCTAEDAHRVLSHTGAAGLMLGRGAMADPRLFQRIRGQAPATPDADQRRAELATHLALVLGHYRQMFCGEKQILAKFGKVLQQVTDPSLQRWVKTLRKHKRCDALAESLRMAQQTP